MRVRRTTRVGPDEVDRLMAGDPSGPDHRGLAALLSAAKAAPTPEELAGERAAVTGFRAAYREAAPTGGPARSSRARRSPVRMATLKVAASVAVLAVGGTAVAAETGRLPAAAQRQAYELFGDLGVPAPRPATGRAAPGPVDSPATGGTGPGASGPASPAATSPSAATSSPSAAAATRAHGLCRAWDAHRRGNGKAMAAGARRELAGLAGGEDRIEAFCAAYLPSPAPQPSATTQPGNGNGNGNNGTGTGNNGTGTGNVNNGGGNENDNNGNGTGNNGGGNGTRKSNGNGKTGNGTE